MTHRAASSVPAHPAGAPTILVYGLGLGLGLGLLAGCPQQQREPLPSPREAPPKAVPKGSQIDPTKLAAFQPPLPALFESPKNPLSEEKIALGRMLFYDKRLSKNHDVSCNTCHNLATYGVDGLKVSLGHKKQTGTRNSPTVYNAAGHFVQFWDGREPDVEAQAKGPVLNPVEMATPSAARVEATLRSIPEYVAAFKKAFPGDKEPTTFENAARAIGAFERKLVTPAPWDRFLAGEQDALSDAEKAGFVKFVDAGCMTCHAGTLVGGTMYQKLGLLKPWKNQADGGRFEATRQEADRMMFKVPSLRNVAQTKPYFHDGGTESLEEAVRLMAEHQLGKELSKEDVAAIVTWLGSLTGQVPADYIKEPTLPPSKPGTPKPDPA
jgi:cytochrome c peroxidase